MTENPIQLNDPREIQRELAKRIKQLRLLAGWKQVTLAERSGVCLGSLKRFEHTGQASVENLLKICHALGRLDEFDALLRPAAAEPLAQLEARYDGPTRKRGSR